MMKPFATLLTLLTLTVPSHAASPRACRIVAASRLNHLNIISTAHTIPHHNNQSQFVVTAFAVPVAVPVAPFAPYWYGVSDYQQTRSFPGSAWERTAPEALPRETASEAQTVERQTSMISQHCTSCHGRTSPKQGLSLVDPLVLSDHDRLRAIRAVINREMPPDTEPPLTDADRNALLRELASP